jgi:hypothetical protein
LRDSTALKTTLQMDQTGPLTASLNLLKSTTERLLKIGPAIAILIDFSYYYLITIIKFL